MNAERWRQIEEAFHAALERPEAERARFLSERFGSDLELRAEIERLLAAAERPARDLRAVVGRAAASFAESGGENLAGETLGRFKLVRKLGEGGMGAVYLALDERLGRQVALKVVPEALGHDSGRMRRFEQEAKAVSALNHPNILTLHDLERSGERVAIVTEYVDGETLAERIARGPMAVDALLDVGAQIADALAEAHRAGIVHRDVKPTNVMVTARGVVKVLDFGLAKILPELGRDPHSDHSEHPETASGMILGTVHYMSPEQAAGREVDHRADLFALGVVLFEMTTGRRPFAADSAVETMQRIIAVAQEPMSRLRADVPAELERIVASCLEKDPARRYQDADALARDLRSLRRAFEGGAEVVSGTSGASGAAWPGVAPVRRRSRGAIVALALGLVVTALGAFALARWRARPPTPAGSTSAPRFLQVTVDPGVESTPALSPDGEAVVYEARGDLWSRRVDGGEAVNLTADSPGEDSEPEFSPDGDSIAFRSEREGGGIFVMGANGESARRLTDFGYAPSWSPDGKTLAIVTERIVWASTRFGKQSELWLVEVADGRSRRLEVDDALHPAVSRDGRWIAFVANRNGRRDLWIVSAVEGNRALVAITADTANEWYPLWSHDGRELFFASDRNGPMAYWKVPIDPKTGRARGTPEPFLLPGSFVASLSWSKDGRRAAYASHESESNLFQFDFDSKAGALAPSGRWLTKGSNSLAGPALSPDGTQIAVHAQVGNREELMVGRSNGSELRRITDDEFKDRRPAWSLDGQRIFWYSNRSGNFDVWSVKPDGSDARRELALGRNISYPKLSPDGRWMSFRNQGGPAFLVAREPGAEPEPLPPLSEPGTWFLGFSWSPDSRRIAGYRVRDEGFGDGISVYSLADRSFRHLTDRGRFPRWLADGRRILYANHGELRLLDSESGSDRLLIDVDPDEVFTCEPSPDERTITCDRRRAEADVWVMARESS